MNLDYFNNSYSKSILEGSTKFTESLKKARINLQTIKFNNRNRSIDLGSGTGAYSIAMRDLGFKEIYSLEYSLPMIKILNQNLKESGIKIIETDIQNIKKYNFSEIDFINCTGDTILYLNSKDKVLVLLAQLYSILNSDGIVYFEFRDFSIEKDLTDSFQITKQSQNFIKTVGTIYEPDHVLTIDLNQIEINGKWNLEKGLSKKLRIDKKEFLEMNESVGMKVRNDFSSEDVVKLTLEKI